VGTGIYFSAYESTKYMLSGSAIPGPLTYAISGGCCGVVAWCLVFPIDTAKVISQYNGLMIEYCSKGYSFAYSWRSV
jgi:hypothetical protein